MKVLIVKDIKEIAKIPEDPKSPVVTGDGAKLVNLTMTGNSVTSCIAETIAAIISSIDVDTAPKDAILYLHYGAVTSNAFETKYTTILGVSGVTDLEDRLKEYVNSKNQVVENANGNAKEIQPELPLEVSTSDDDANNQTEEDAQIVE